MNKKEFTNVENLIIDEFYNENTSTEKIKYNKDNTSIQNANEFKHKMDNALECMDIIKDDSVDFDINIMDIINEAEMVNYGKVNIFELFAFILTAVLILGLFIFTSLMLGKNFIIYFEIGITSLLPFILIPISKHILTKEV